ncbi:hypothetical protein OK016_16170 [Vibrio chagasii]|nr:hypothetical protein [Vibrio chagasii]
MKTKSLANQENLMVIKYPLSSLVGLTEIQKQITDFLDKINELPLDATIANLKWFTGFVR